MVTKANLAYINSGSWKCPKAVVNPDFPAQVEHNTGAHHWVERWFGDKVGHAFICRYCFDVRRFTTNYKSGMAGTVKDLELSGQ